MTIMCFGIDFILCITQLINFGKNDWILEQTCMLFFLVIFLVVDVIYFIWLGTLKFSLPDEIISPVRKAIFGSIDDIKIFASRKIRIGI